jgi:transposase
MGMELKKLSVEPRVENLVNYMKRNYPGGIYKFVYEAGFCGFWILRKLKEMGYEAIIVNAADVPTMQKEKLTKTDKIDSGKLSREYENGSLKAIYIPTPAQQSLRSYSRLREQLVKQQTRLANRVKGFFNLHGIEILSKNLLSKKGRQWIENLEFSERVNKLYLITLFEDLVSNYNQLLKVNKNIREMSKGIKEIEYIQSVPGIGYITAFTIYSELCDIKRFKNLDTVKSLVGFIPIVRSSDEKITVGGLTHRGNRYLKRMLIQAAWQAIRRDPALTLAYRELKKRMIGQKAIIMIVKKLLNRIRYCWLRHQYYNLAVVQ